jgi:hypothetical protein
VSDHPVWYYADQDQTKGPFSFEELVEALRRPAGAEEVPVWSEGYRDWVRAGDVPELSRLLVQPIPRPDHFPSPRYGRLAIGLYVAGFLCLGSIIADRVPALNLAFLVAAGTMRDIRISRL